MLSHTVLPARVEFNPKSSINTAINIFDAVRQAAGEDPDLHGTIVLLLGLTKAYDTLQRPFLLSVLVWLGFLP